METRTRLLMTISDLRGGGAEREFSNLLHSIPRKQFDLEVSYWRNRFVFPSPEDIPVTILEKNRPWHAWRVVRRFAKIVDRFRPNVVFSQLHYVNLLTGTALKLARHKPAWVCRQVNDPSREYHWSAYPWAKAVLRRADAVVGCSQGVSGAMRDYFQLRADQVVTLPNVVRIEEIETAARCSLPIPRSDDDFVFLHVGRFSRQKNHRLLLDAFRRLQDPRVKLWVMGQGELENELRRLCTSWGIEDRVRWLGFHENPFPFINAADACVLSSDHEGCPNILIESMLLGTPVVSTRCPYGPDELITDGETGRLVEPNDVEALSRAMRDTSDHPQHALGMAEVGRRKIRHAFDPDLAVKAYIKLFHQLGGQGSGLSSQGHPSSRRT